MNYVHFTFENIFDYKSVLEQIPNDITFYDCVADIDLLQLTLCYWQTPVYYQDFIASICNRPYEVTITTVCDS